MRWELLIFFRLPRWYVKSLEGNAIIHDWNLQGHMIKNNLKVENKASIPIKAGAGLTKTMAPESEESVIALDLPKALKNRESFYDNFYNVIIDNSKAFVQNKEVLQVMKLIEAMFESHETSQIIHF